MVYSGPMTYQATQEGTISKHLQQWVSHIGLKLREEWFCQCLWLDEGGVSLLRVHRLTKFRAEPHRLRGRGNLCSL